MRHETQVGDDPPDREDDRAGRQADRQCGGLANAKAAHLDQARRALASMLGVRRSRHDVGHWAAVLRTWVSCTMSRMSSRSAPKAGAPFTARASRVAAKALTKSRAGRAQM